MTAHLRTDGDRVTFKVLRTASVIKFQTNLSHKNAQVSWVGIAGIILCIFPANER